MQNNQARFKELVAPNIVELIVSLHMRMGFGFVYASTKRRNFD